MGKYNSFKLVEGGSVSRDYKNHKIITPNGNEVYSFPHHSAGPFGEDVNGDWMPAGVFFRLLGLAGLGWKDIHATTVCDPTTNKTVRMRDYFLLACKEKAISSLKPITPKLLRGIIKKISSLPH
jgi:hypothetical protein